MTSQPLPPPAPSTAGTVSVVLAAFDAARWDLLVAAVRSVQAEPGTAAMVVLAVDNNEPLFFRARRELPGVTVVHNTGPRGASAARNAGAAVATGELLAFLDDDAEALPGWLGRLLAPLDRPDVVGVGGGVVPNWLARAPRWFPMEFGWVVGASYTGLPEQGGVVRNVWSENMAVRAADFRRAGGFREGFGKVGHASRPEDTEFCVRLQSAHSTSRWWYEPTAVVRHAVPAERSTVRFFLRRCLAEGRGKAALSALVGEEGMSSEKAHLVRALPLGVVRGLRDGLSGDATGLARSGMIVLGAAAAAVGLFQERRAIRVRT